MFGRQPHLPVELVFGLPMSHEPKSHSQYVHKLKDHLEESCRVATKNVSKTAECNKHRFDRRVVESSLEAGDHVLVRNVWIRGKHKLVNKRESDVHVVVKCAGDLPMHAVKPEGKDGPLRTVTFCCHVGSYLWLSLSNLQSRPSANLEQGDSQEWESAMSLKWQMKIQSQRTVITFTTYLERH